MPTGFYEVDDSDNADPKNNPRISFTNNKGHSWFQMADFTLNDVSQVFNQPETASFTISPVHPAAEYLPLKARNFECRIDLPEQDQPTWGELVSVAGGPEGITFQVVGHLGMFGDRFVDRKTLEWTSYPQADIIKELIEYAQDEEKQKYRDFNIVPRILDLGTIKNKERSRIYYREEHTPILDALHEFQDTDTPIDLKMSYHGPATAGGDWVRNLDIIPRYDIIWPYATYLYFGSDSGSTNILSFEWSEDATAMTNDVYCGGGSSGNVRFEGHYVDQRAAWLHYDRQAIINAGDMTDPAWLKAKAKAEVAARKRAKQRITIRSISVAAGIGRYAWAGTIWPIKINYGRIQVNGNFRIVKRTYTSNRVVTLELEEITKPIKRPSDIFGEPDTEIEPPEDSGDDEEPPPGPGGGM